MSTTLSQEAKFQERDIELACAFADDNDETFDSEFVYSLRDRFKTHKFLTDKQYQALQNTIERWHMEEWAAKEGFEFEVKK